MSGWFKFHCQSFLFILRTDYKAGMMSRTKHANKACGVLAIVLAIVKNKGMEKSYAHISDVLYNIPPTLELFQGITVWSLHMERYDVNGNDDFLMI